MMLKFFFITFSLIANLSATDKAPLSVRAEKLFDEMLYQDSALLYQRSLEEPEPLDREYIQRRLAECYVELNEPLLALKSLSNLSENYSKAVALRKLKNYLSAIDALKNETLTPQICCELGLNYLHLRNYDQAKICFLDVLNQDSHQSDLCDWARLYLARIALYMNEYESAEDYLIQIKVDSNHGEGFEYEWNLLYGLTQLSLARYESAADSFERNLKFHQQSYSLIIPLLLKSWIETAKFSENPSKPLKNAEELIRSFGNFVSEPEQYQFYLARVRLLNDSQASEHLHNFLLQSSHFSESQKKILLAENEISSGQTFYKNGKHAEAQMAYQKAEHYLSDVPLTSPKDQALVLKLKATSAYLQEQPEKSHLFLNQILQDQSLLNSLEAPHEVFYLSAIVENDYQIKVEKLKNGISFLDDRKESEILYMTLAMCYLFQNEKKAAKETLDRIKEIFPTCKNDAQFRFLQALSIDSESQKREELHRIYLQFPKSRFAPIAYYSIYTSFEYLHGQREAIKHLMGFTNLFSDHPLVIHAYYLIGLYHSKDHISEQGKILRYRNLNAAIEAFQFAESKFDELFGKHKQILSSYAYYEKLSLKCQLERGQANLSVAVESHETKKIIYLEYAEKVFVDLIQGLKTDGDPFKNTLLDQAQYSLGKVYREKNDLQLADQAWAELISRHPKQSEEKGYLLSRTFFEKGELALCRQQYNDALHNFLEAEQCAQGVSSDQKLELWIKQSYCCKELSRLDEAMALLSKVINEDVISSLRIEAMLLRSDLYHAQGRTDLARKQLKAVINKGGIWAQTAKEIEKERYGDF